MAKFGEFKRRPLKTQEEGHSVPKLYAEYDTQNIKEYNKTRRDNGLDPILVKERSCLTCNREFTSHGAANRMCTHCRCTKEDAGWG